VRVAVALVTGQALLCAVIGYVTFGPSDPPPQAAAPVEPLAGPAMPTPRMPQPSAAVSAGQPAVPSPRPSRTARTSESPVTLIGPAPTTRPPTSATPAKTTDRPMLEAPPAPPLLDVPTPNPMLTPSPTAPPVEDDPCETEGAEGQTAAGVNLVCTRLADGSLVWLIN
jgi:hypothetical protein